MNYDDETEIDLDAILTQRQIDEVRAAHEMSLRREATRKKPASAPTPEEEIQSLKQQIADAHAVLDEAKITRVWAISKTGEKTLAERVRLLTEAHQTLSELYEDLLKRALAREASHP